MDIFIPDTLERQMHEEGEEGIAWLRSLPERIAELERAWGFRVGPAFNHGGCVSWVAPVELADGGEAVLKMGFPHEEARYEADALRLLDGQGAVRLFWASEDGFSLLLERCLPGTDLWSLPEADRDAVACTVLSQLWRELPPDAPFLPLTDLMARWEEEIPEEAPAAGHDAAIVAEVIRRGRELAASQPRKVLLHGDLNPGNVLAATREPWLVIDPKPFLGEPAFDLAQWFHNRHWAVTTRDPATAVADPVAVLRGEMEWFADALGLDAGRIAGWTFVKALGWDNDPETVALFGRVAEAWP